MIDIPIKFCVGTVQKSNITARCDSLAIPTNIKREHRRATRKLDNDETEESGRMKISVYK